MAQDFVGSNNINLLVPSGQFGTRLAGGADAASPRYIFTHLSPIARYLFPEVDDALLTYREDDGQLIEPHFFCPVIPLLPINGSIGIGTGWSTFIPPHSPQDVLDYIRAKLDGAEHFPPIRPYARGFDGDIIKTESGYLTLGRALKKSDKTVVIDELPLRLWTDDYKERLLKMREQGEITGFIENHTTTKVSFTVHMKGGQLTRLAKNGLEKGFKLTSSLPTTNIHAFDADGNIQKFSSAEGLADAFFPIRLALYEDRKSVLESDLNHSATTLRNRARFIEAVTTGKVELTTGKKTKEQLSNDLESLGMLKASDLKAIRDDNVLVRRATSLKESAEDIHETDVASTGEFDYLLNMPISSLTSERINELRQDAARKEDLLKNIRDTSAADIWREDLEKLSSML
jgi:DNA topoisomerase II